MGNLTFVLVGYRKLNLKCKVSNDFFSGAEVTQANSYKYVFGQVEEFEGRDIAIS